MVTRRLALPMEGDANRCRHRARAGGSDKAHSCQDPDPPLSPVWLQQQGLMMLSVTL